MTPYLMHLTTLGSLRDVGYVLTAWCTAPASFGICAHYRLLDLNQLIEQYGADHGCRDHDLAPKLRCIKCGSGQHIRLIVEQGQAASGLK